MSTALRLRRCGRAIFAAVLLSISYRLCAAPRVAKPSGMHPQFGAGSFAASKILQEFHLPSSPSDLLSFVLEYSLKQKLGNTLPLTLNANSAYLTVENGQLPGGPFHGQPLSPTANNLHIALAPGDYLVPVMAYCTQYSVHRPGQGTAYKLAPVQGTQAQAISTLLWRGTLAGKSPQELQATNWAIQAGVTYDSMPKPYQALIDQLIPEFRNGLRGNMLDVIQSTYREATTDPRKALQTYIKQTYNKTLPVMLLPKFTVPAPSLEVLLAKMGPPGQLLLDAKKQSTILLTSYTTKERGEQVLFEGQGERLPPEPAGEGPWTVRIPGQAYMRFLIGGGNMEGNNLMQIRILPGTAATREDNKAHVVLASYTVASAASALDVPPTSVDGLLGVQTREEDTTLHGVQTLTSLGVIGYAVGGNGAQALVAVASPVPAQKPTAQIAVLVHNQVTYKLQPESKASAVHAGLCLYVGAKISDPDHVYAQYRWIQKVTTTDNTGLRPSTFVDDSRGTHPGVDSQPTDAWFYRPPESAFDAAWVQAGQELGYDLLYRDEPQRAFNEGTRGFHVETELIGVKSDGTFDEKAPVASFTWGWSRSNGPLQPSPVTVNGTVWQGSPLLKGQQATYLCDPTYILKTDPDHNMPLRPDTPPLDYRKTPFYRFVP